MHLPKITKEQEKAVLEVQAAINKLPPGIKILIDIEDEENAALMAYFDIGKGNWMAVHQFNL